MDRLYDITHNPYILPVLSVFLTVYAALVRPEVPPYMRRLFKNKLFQMVVLSYIVYRGNRDPTIAILIGVGFVVTMSVITEMETKEKFANL